MHVACVSSLTRDQSDAFGSESAESEPLDQLMFINFKHYV